MQLISVQDLLIVHELLTLLESRELSGTFVGPGPRE